MLPSDPVVLRIPDRIDSSLIPRWLVEKYAGMEADIAKFFESYYFWEAWSGQTQDIEDALRVAQANAQAKFKALTQTNVLRGAASRSVLLQLYEAQKTGWFRYIGGMDDVRMLLEHIRDEAIERDKDGGERYEVDFLLKTLLPTLEALDVPKEQILTIPQNISKARSMVSTTRKLISAYAKQPDELRKALVVELQDVADPQISVRDYRQRSAERMGKTQPEAPEPVEGAIYLIPGAELIVIQSDRAHTIAIQNALKGIVHELGVRDATVLLKFLSQKVSPKANHMELMGLDLIGDEPVVIRGKGSLMPTQDSLGNLVLTEVGRQRFLIEELLDSNGEAWVPIYILGTHIKEKDILRFVQHAFSFSRRNADVLAEQAFGKVYKTSMIPVEVYGMLESVSLHLIMMWHEQEESYGLFLKVVRETDPRR